MSLGDDGLIIKSDSSGNKIVVLILFHYLLNKPDDVIVFLN